MLYSCDEWKANESLICASTTANKIKKAIISEIKKGNMYYADDYDGNEKHSKNKQNSVDDHPIYYSKSKHSYYIIIKENKTNV